MEIKTFNTILTEICDYFDVLISPKRITRSNSNVIYLMFKAVAKGYEVIHNVVVTLSHKFDPAYCSDEDLVSTAMLVGTEKLKGSYSGLQITLTNNSAVAKTLPAGTYYYELDANTKFYFTVDSAESIASSGTKTVIALTDKVGVYPVTAQTSIEIKDALPSEITASCLDNNALLGAWEESNLDFRKRILSDTARQDLFSELEMKIKNLPYVFDCSLKFNDTTSSVSVGSITVPPFHLLVLISGEPRAEIAEIISKYGIYPTTEVDSDDFVEYENDVFISGSYKVYYTLFSEYEYTANVIYKADENFISASQAEEKIRAHLLVTMNSNVRKANITENDIYNSLENLNLDGVEILAVELYVNSNRVQYVAVPQDKLSKLTSVNTIEAS